MATGTVEEKIFQRQLSKEGLQSVVDDKAQVNELSTKDLKNLFKVSTSVASFVHIFIFLLRFSSRLWLLLFIATDTES